jgi:8-oxo-dGTP pyrophosphatase MutT (NUDIX family)
MAKDLVRAAGGLVWRMSNGVQQVLLVHRPHYDDWSFPKGKHDLNETDLECAVREVVEETGLSVKVGDALPTVEYVDHKGRDKTVAYWAMTVAEGSNDEAFVANDEVDEIRWLDVDTALKILTYPIDQVLLQEFVR